MKRKNPAAAALVKRRWDKTTKKQRSEIMSSVRAHGGGRPRSTDRCYCGQTTMATATTRRFDCCKRAGKFPLPVLTESMMKK